MNITRSSKTSTSPAGGDSYPKNNQSSLFVASGVDDDVKDYGALRREYLRDLSLDELVGLLPTQRWNGNKLDDKRDKENGMPVTKPLRDCCGHLSGLMVIHAP